MVSPLRRKIRLAALAAGSLGAVVLPLIRRAPLPALNLPYDVRTVDEAVEHCRTCQCDGWELVDHATALVNEKFTRYSTWHLWESPRRAFQHSRGYSEQYNMALAEILTRLGFEVTVVRSDKVDFDIVRPQSPHLLEGHCWLKVRYAGEERDVCASRKDNRAGAVRFRIVEPEYPVGPYRLWGNRVQLLPPAIGQIWTSMLTSRPVARWMYRGFHDQG